MAKILIIGEAPGQREDEEGRPFVGAAGKFLTELLKGIGLSREKDVYITNVVKCRPPANRDPKDDEIEACKPYLLKQINLIKPRLIITLGNHAGKLVFNLIGLSWKGVMKHRGKVYEGIINGVKVLIVPTLHPASVLYNPRLKSVIDADFNLIKKVKSEIDKHGVRKKTSLLNFIKG